MFLLQFIKVKMYPINYRKIIILNFVFKKVRTRINLCHSEEKSRSPQIEESEITLHFLKALCLQIGNISLLSFIPYIVIYTKIKNFLHTKFYHGVVILNSFQ
jgi:hypothetical protein